jgi:hypothetical protein
VGKGVVNFEYAQHLHTPAADEHHLHRQRDRFANKIADLALA